MCQVQINWPAVRAFLHAAREMYARQDADHRCNRNGCICSAQMLNALHCVEERVLACRIGVRFGLTGALLMDHVWFSAEAQADRFREAQISTAFRHWARAAGAMELRA